MKTSTPVTTYDLECTARDDKRGIAEYRGVKVYWDDATNTFSYWLNGVKSNSKEAAHTLEK